MMTQLSSNWFVEGLQDFEYKKYLLLAYLQSVKARFDDARLYPEFPDLIMHLNNMTAFKESKSQLESRFPKKLSGIDPEKLEMLYESIETDSEVSQDLEQLMDYSLPLLHRHVEEGKELYEFIDNSLSIESVGLLPLSKRSGYFLLRGGEDKEVKAFEYTVTIFEHAQEKFRGLRTRFLASFRHGLANTYEMIKLELIRKNKALPNPATYLIHSRLHFPENESLFPVAKRKFMRYLATEAA